jgi:hypothetical protein
MIMFFILSTGRSGSKSIAEFLSLSGQVTCLHEPEPTLVEESRKYLYGEYDNQEMVSLLKNTRVPVINGKEYGESNNRLSYIIPALSDAFNDCKFIWLVRDGREVVKSFYSLGWYDDEVSKKSVWTMNFIEAPKTGDMSIAEWGQLDPFARCCWYWTFTNNRINDELFKIDKDNWIFLKLESIDDSLDSLYQFLGINKIEGDFPWLNLKRQRVKIKSWKDWSEKQKASFEAICGDTMDMFYPGWRSKDVKSGNFNIKIRSLMINKMPVFRAFVSNVKKNIFPFDK